MLHCPRKITRTLVYSGIFFATGLAPALALDPTGDWRVADGVANIRVAQCNGSIWGAVSWEQRPGGRDEHNPDVSKQNRPTLGMPILIDMKKKPDTEAWQGQVYNAKDGQYYSSTIKPVDADHMEIQGCVLGFLCGGATWTRSSPQYPKAPSTAWRRAARPWPRSPRRPRRRPPGRPARLPKVRNRRPRPIRSAISVYSPISRGLPISAGWNNSTAASVVTSDSANSLPMLEVPGWLDSHRLPNAVAVVMALKNIARVRLVCSRVVLPERHAGT